MAHVAKSFSLMIEKECSRLFYFCWWTLSSGAAIFFVEPPAKFGSWWDDSHHCIGHHPGTNHADRMHILYPILLYYYIVRIHLISQRDYTSRQENKLSRQQTTWSVICHVHARTYIHCQLYLTRSHGIQVNACLSRAIYTHSLARGFLVEYSGTWYW